MADAIAPLDRMEQIPRGARIARTIVIDWQLSSYFGWGIYGLQLALNWLRQQRAYIVTRSPVHEAQIDLNPIERASLGPALDLSRDVRTQLEPFRGRDVTLDLPVLQALGNDCLFAAQDVRQGIVSGSPTLGVTFFESTAFSDAGRERAKRFPLIVAGSTWNKTVLEAAGIGPVAVVLQGIDPTAFHPGPKAGIFAGRFAVFSGGKLEYRKGQDLVLAAFRVFAQRHPDAILVTAWASPWPAVARTFAVDPTIPPVPFTADGRLDILGWAALHGIPPAQTIDLGALPNSALPRIYREMDVGVFPNRCEGGTNLVAMECMACGVPVILSRNSGHLDLIADERCFPLERQGAIAGDDHIGWGESDVEEIVETLEAVYRAREDARARAARGAAFLRTLTWATTAARLSETIAPYV